jgi:hypothetical protein
VGHVNGEVLTEKFSQTLQSCFEPSAMLSALCAMLLNWANFFMDETYRITSDISGCDPGHPHKRIVDSSQAKLVNTELPMPDPAAVLF